MTLHGIHAHLIRSKPAYAAFLHDIRCSGGEPERWPSPESFADGALARAPHIGVVLQADSAHTEIPFSALTLDTTSGRYSVQGGTPEPVFGAALLRLGAADSARAGFFAPLPDTTTVLTLSLSDADVTYADSMLFSVDPPKGAVAWSEIITRWAGTLVDDNRFSEQFTANRARFFEDTFSYLHAAIPRVNRPARLVPYLSCTPPCFSSDTWTVPGEAGAQTQAESILYTRRSGYEICSVVSQTLDRFGNPIETPCPAAVYDPQTGIVRLPAGLETGTTFVLDFATDGYFHKPLTAEIKRLLGLSFQLVWENRFGGGWLARTPKLADKSFLPPNESNWTRAQEEKRRSLELSFNEELRRYEQVCAELAAARGEPQALF